MLALACCRRLAPSHDRGVLVGSSARRGLAIVSAPRKGASMSNSDEALTEIGPEEAADLIAEGAFLLDVREADERQAGRAAAADHVPLGDLEGRLAGIPSADGVVCIWLRGP